MGERFFGEGHGEKVVGIEACDSGPAQVVGDPLRRDLLCQSPEFFKVVKIEWVGASNRHRDAMHHEGVVFTDFLQNGARIATAIHEIFRDDFEPIDRWFVLKDVAEVRASQAHTEPEVWQLKSICH